MAYTPKMPRKRSRRKKKKDELTVLDWVKIVLFVVVSAALVSVFIFLKADIGNVADDYGKQASDLNGGKANSKSQFNKQFEYANEKKQEENQLANQNGNKGGSFSGGSLEAKENGELITDTTLNPYGMPIYDGWTLNEDELLEFANDNGIDSSIVSIWDVDYSQFSSSDFSNIPQLYGLGDFTSSPLGHPMVSIMKISACSSNSLQMVNWNKAKANGIYEEKTVTGGKKAPLIDGRIPVALPWRVVTDANKVTPEVEAEFNDSEGLTVNSPKGANGTKENSINIGKPASDVWNVSACLSMYIDLLLDDGSVIALVTADNKAVHLGGPVNKWGDVCDDIAANGYAHIRYSNQPGNWGYQGVIELICAGDSLGDTTARDMMQLSGKKIVGFRAYGVKYVVNGNVVKWSDSRK